MVAKVCKNVKCGKPFEVSAKFMWQVYCCRECSPYGYMKDEMQRDKMGRVKRCLKKKEDKSPQAGKFLPMSASPLVRPSSSGS